jgi:Uma2 family endonuclease
VHVVQPDVFVVCDEYKINDKGCSGAPDLIVEVVSPATKSHDYFKKAALYESFSVREYWIIDPLKFAITIYTLIADGDFNIPVIYNFCDNIKVSIFEELFMNTTEF